MIRRYALLAILVLVIGIQLVPCRVANPAVVEEPAWDSPATQEVARRACFDCHSNEVRIPWYGYVAPASWLVRRHVDEGRAKLNFSEMNMPTEDAHEAGEEVIEGKMPPRYYTLLHPAARLSDDERRSLAAGLDATLREEHP